jgi:23S rRNA-/tRNA-specific pseudouridylate synthase
VFLFSTPEAEKRLRELMQERKIIKQYLTIVRGIPQPSEGKIFFLIIRNNFYGCIRRN